MAWKGHKHKGAFNGQVVDMLKQELLGVPEEADGILVYHHESGEFVASSIMPRHPAAEDQEIAATLADVEQFLRQAWVKNDPVLAGGSDVVSCPYRFLRTGKTGLYTPV